MATPINGDGHSQGRTLTARTRRDSGRSLAHMELLRDDDEAEIPRAPFVARFVKRTLDLVLASAIVILLLPLLVVVGVAIKLDSPGPVFFAHRRLGRNGRHFDCLKFRSMQVDAEHLVFEDEVLRHHYVSNHFKIPVELDPRITRLGRFLRQSSIDELPQLWNVLRGEMSLVGPRPIVALEATHYGDSLNLLLSVRPGLTGLWAVTGRSQLGYPQRTEVELSYVREQSFKGDLLILARTPWTVLTQRGTI